ncbi:hypothetical protein [Mycobacterium sp. NPDC006124]|uniref:LppU family putative lipoprotein n=1 Tax=Mycobacterium sp. NPDC006124 TaxID=3156729 RepID=UPI0033AFDEE9
MKALPAVVVVAMALAGCSSAAEADVRAGDCLQVGGPPDRPETARVQCGSSESNFRVVDVVQDSDDCPGDVDTYYSTRSSFSGSGSTICLDVDWVVGGCMSVDPENSHDPVRVDCRDRSASNRQRATQIMRNVANVDQCATGTGYAYGERRFTVCVEDVS